MAEGVPGEQAPRFKVPEPIRCHRTTALMAKQADYRNAAHGGALLWRVERR